MKYLFIAILLILALIFLGCFCPDYNDENKDNEHFISYYGGCSSPFCRHKRWWYNWDTPFVWNNPTRYYGWPWYPWYSGTYGYYADSYRYGLW